MSFPLRPDAVAGEEASTKANHFRGSLIVPIGKPGVLTVSEQVLISLWHGRDALVLTRANYTADRPRLGPYHQTTKALKRLTEQGVISTTKGRRGHGCSRVEPGPRFAVVAACLRGVHIEGHQRRTEVETEEERRAFDHLQATMVRTDKVEAHGLAFSAVLPVLPFRASQTPQGNRKKRPGRIYFRGTHNPQTIPRQFRHLLSLHFGGATYTDLIELDFCAIQPRLLYAEARAEPRADPYDMVMQELGCGQEFRPQIKGASMRMINAKGRSNGLESLRRLWSGLTDKWPTWSVPFTVESFVAAFETVHGPTIGHLLWKPTSSRLQHQDSEILIKVILCCADAGIPLIPIHDAVIIPTQFQTIVESFMDSSSMAVTGVVLPLKVKLISSPSQVIPQGLPLKSLREEHPSIPIAYTATASPNPTPKDHTMITTKAATHGRTNSSLKSAARTARITHLDGGWKIAPDTLPGVGWVLTDPTRRRKRYYATEAEARAAYGFYAFGIPAVWVRGIRPHSAKGTQGITEGEIVGFSNGSNSSTGRQGVAIPA